MRVNGRRPASINSTTNTPLASASRSHSRSESLSTATPESPLRERTTTRMPKTDSNDASYPPNPPHNNNDEAEPMFSPRSSNYERLEGGHGPSANRFGKKKLFTWKRFAIGAGVLILLVWLFGPSDTKERLPWSSGAAPEKEGVEAPTTRPTTTPPINDDIELHPPPPSQNQNHPTRPPTHPTSYETDSDPSSTTYCTSPHSPGTPIVQWALMIDAGSTGSRIHIYKFNNCASHPSFEYEVFKMIKGGLSSYAGHPTEAAKSLDELMDEAMRVVPEALRKCTPVAVKATAGLRLLPGDQSTDILKAVEGRLNERYPFQVEEVVVMDGKDEGVYAWITANYLLGTIGKEKSEETYAVLDLGGASTQIVFEPKFSKPDYGLEEGDHKYHLEFLGKTYTLYQHSYLGYGLMRARMRIHQVVEFMSLFAPDRKDGEEEVYGNPCIAKGMKREVELEDVKTGNKRTVTMVGEQIGSFEACNRVVELALAKDAICKLKPCSFNGVYQPSLLDTFPNGKVLLLSYFYDRLEPLLSSSHEETITHKISDIAELAKTVCEGPTAWKAIPGASLEELEGRPEYCLDLTFMHALLRLGYEFGKEKEVTVGKKVEGTELGWCLGATIGMVGGGKLECRI